MPTKAGLCLCCLQRPEDRFFRGEAHMLFKAKTTSFRQMLRKTCRTGTNIKTETQLNHAPALMQEDFAFPMEK